jgi:ABC-type glutathione transport system ATPase component
MSLMQVSDLHVWFDLPHGAQVHAVQGVSFDLAAGERFGLVGESGSGKTTTVLALMGLLPPTATLAGQVRIDGRDILAGGEESVRPHRWKDIAMVFQGAMNALNPVKTVRWQIAEPMAFHGVAEGAAARKRRSLPARVLRRHAAARLDRDGARLPAEDPAGGRADHRPGRHGAGADTPAAHPAVRRARPGADPGHP